MANETDILLRHLPEIYHHDSQDLRTLLTAFEEVLLGNKGSDYEGLEQIIANIPNLFDPAPGIVLSKSILSRTPANFLPWLAQWVALGQLQQLPRTEKEDEEVEEQYRNLIARIVPLYAIRGTKSYLKEILGMYFPEINVEINDEALPSMKVGYSIIGKDTRLGGDIPFYFYVKLLFPAQESEHPQLLERVRAVIDLAKPAHTAYQLECDFAG
ncbi:MAG: phage tail protein [Methylococcales bacterium]|nr:phage tail protein [Methylococcales bacterium]